MKNGDPTGTRRVVAATLVAALAIVAGLMAGCSRQTEEQVTTRELTIVSFAVTEEAYAEVIPLFQSYWKDKTGEDVQFVESFGGSASQARAVIDGLEADVVHLAMEPDVRRIEEAGLIEAGWQDRAPRDAIPSTSLIVLGVRPGNPEGLDDWNALAGEGVAIVTPDPKTSGGARWNVLGAWGSITQTGGTEEAAMDLLAGIFGNTKVLAPNARDATNTFLQQRIGDAVIMWESEALLAKAEGEELDIVYPANTVLAETAVAVVDANAKAKGNEEVARAFVDFLFTPEAQRAFAEAGLRPVDEGVLAEYADVYFAPSGKQYTIDDFGGWAEADTKFFVDGALYDQIQQRIRGDR
ncbi:MAG: sulfate ABC transporter substrate-binding protein [Actinobacteria bacterium]|nr:sulfate ABC transporter substrate-binding protein [Actinomycetota bacterium]